MNASQTLKIQKGNVVSIRPEWQDEGDDEFTWVATEDEDGGRVSISPINIDLSIIPIQRVDVAMLEPLTMRKFYSTSLKRVVTIPQN